MCSITLYYAGKYINFEVNNMSPRKFLRSYNSVHDVYTQKNEL